MLIYSLKVVIFFPKTSNSFWMIGASHGAHGMDFTDPKKRQIRYEFGLGGKLSAGSHVMSSVEAYR